MPDRSPPPPSKRGERRPSYSREGRDSKATSRSDYRNRGNSRERSRSADLERHRRRRDYDDRRKRSVSRSDEDRPKRRAPRSLSPAEEEHERRRPKRRSRSRDRERDGSQERPRRRHSRDRQRRERSRSPDRRPREPSRERKPKDTYRDHSPRDKHRHHHKERDRSHDRHSRRSASPAPHRPSHKRRDRSPSPPRRHRRDSRSPTPTSHKKSKRTRHSPSRSPSPPRRNRKPLPDQEVAFRGTDNASLPPTKYGGAPPSKERPNFGTTGVLAKEANLVAGTKISLKYHEPPEARKPPSSAPWRIFIFKGDEMLQTIELHTQSCWLLGRAHEVADILLAHPSCSQQHAAIQFRYILKKKADEYGVEQKKGKVKPYLIDLESSNGTMLNGERIEGGRYVELRDKDIIKFGGSEREYVVMLPPPDQV